MEKRRFSRTPFFTSGSLLVESQGLECVIRNLSLKGALVQLNESVQVGLGTPVTLSFLLNGEDMAISAQGTCVHLEDSDVGIRFTSMDLDSLTHLRRLMELNTADAESINRELGFLVDE